MDCFSFGMCVDEDQKWSPGWYFPSTTSQGFGHPQGMVWAVSYKQYQRPTAGPLCFSRPLVLTLAVPLFLLMVVRGGRAGPAANRCSVIGIAVYVRVPTRVPKSTLVEVHRTGERAQASAAWYKGKKQVSPMLLGSNLSTATQQWCKIGQVTNFFES